MCRSFFYAALTYCALPITVTVRSRSKNEHFSLYREKAGEEKEGERRLWERCVNRLRFSTVSIAAAREKRGRGFLAQAACRRSFALPYYEQKSIRSGLLVLSKFLSGVDTIDLHAERTPDAVLKNAS